METIHTGATTTPPIDHRVDLYDAASDMKRSELELKELLDAF